MTSEIKEISIPITWKKRETEEFYECEYGHIEWLSDRQQWRLFTPPFFVPSAPIHSPYSISDCKETFARSLRDSYINMTAHAVTKKAEDDEEISPCYVHFFNNTPSNEHTCPVENYYIDNTTEFTWNDDSSKQDKVATLENFIKEMNHHLNLFLIIYEHENGKMYSRKFDTYDYSKCHKDLVRCINFTKGIFYIPYNKLILFTIKYGYEFDSVILDFAAHALNEEFTNLFNCPEPKEDRKNNIFWASVKGCMIPRPIYNRIIPETVYQNNIEKIVKYDKLRQFCYLQDSEKDSSPYEGILNCIDENRQLLEELNRIAPQLMRKYTSLGARVKDLDKFLLTLCDMLDMPTQLNDSFPRKGYWENNKFRIYVNDYLETKYKFEHKCFIVQNGIVKQVKMLEALEHGNSNYYALCTDGIRIDTIGKSVRACLLSFDRYTPEYGKSVRTCLLPFGRCLPELSNEKLADMYLNGIVGDYPNFTIFPIHEELYNKLLSAEENNESLMSFDITICDGYAVLKPNDDQQPPNEFMIGLRGILSDETHKDIENVKRKLGVKKDLDLAKALSCSIEEIQELRKSGSPCQLDEFMKEYGIQI